MSRINRFIIENAELQAAELAHKGEKWGAYTIASLLTIIEDLSQPAEERIF